MDTEKKQESFIKSNLTLEERVELSALGQELKTDFGKIKEVELWRAVYNIKGFPSLNKLAKGNVEVAKLLLKAEDRGSSSGKDELIEYFLFENTDPENDELIKNMLPEYVKRIRKATGLSLNEFANEYGISLNSISAWETGKRNITKYVYRYLKECQTDKIEEVKKEKVLELPLALLDAETIESLGRWSKAIPDLKEGEKYIPDVQHTEASPIFSENYTVLVDSSEKIDNVGTPVTSWMYYPIDLGECIAKASSFGCRKVVFYKEMPDYCTKVADSLRESIKESKEFAKKVNHKTK